MKTKPILTNYFKAITNVASQGDRGRAQRMGQAVDTVRQLDSRHKYCGKHGKMVVIPDTFVS